MRFDLYRNLPTRRRISTDTALIIDAMDLLHSKLVDGFCIVSSDSDYTGLAHRIREEGLFIMGIGRSHTPEAFVKACESFTFTDILVLNETAPGGKAEAQIPPTKLKKEIDLDAVQRAYQIAVNIDTGMANLSRLSEVLRSQDPTFDPRNYGFTSFRKFCDALRPSFQTVFAEDGTTLFLVEKQVDTDSVKHP